MLMALAGIEVARVTSGFGFGCGVGLGAGSSWLALGCG